MGTRPSYFPDPCPLLFCDATLSLIPFSTCQYPYFSYPQFHLNPFPFLSFFPFVSFIPYNPFPILVSPIDTTLPPPLLKSRLTRSMVMQYTIVFFFVNPVILIIYLFI